MKIASVFNFKKVFLVVTVLAVCCIVSPVHAAIKIPVGSAPGYPASFNGKVYIPNDESNTVSVIDSATDTVIHTISVGQNPFFVVSLGDKLYVSNIGDATVSVIDAATYMVTDTVSTEGNPNFMAVVGDKIYVNDGSGYVSVIDSTDESVSNIATGDNPYFVTSVGTKVYGTNFGSDYMSVIDSDTDTVTGTISGITHGSYILTVGTKLYMFDGQGNSVTVVDSLTDTVIGSISVGSNPAFFSKSINGKVYVVNRGSNSVSVIDATTDTVIDTISVGDNPQYSLIDGNKLYVLSSSSVSVIDTATDTVIDTIATGTSISNYITVSGSKLYGVDPVNNAITVVRLDLLPAVQSFSTSSPSGTYTEGQDIEITAHFNEAIEPDSTMTVLLNTGRSLTLSSVSGSTLSGTYTIGSDDHTPDLAISSITAASVSDGTHTRTSYDLPSSQGSLVAENSFITRNLGDSVNITIGSYQTIDTGTNPYQISAPVNGFLYVANQGSNTVSVINQSTNAVVHTIPVGSEPYGLSLANGNLYVANTLSNTVSVIDTATNTVISTIPVGIHPYYVATIGTNVYVTNGSSNTVSVISSLTDTVTDTIAVGSYPRGIKAHGTDLYVANYGDPNYSGGNSVSVINSLTNTVSDTIIMPAGVDGPRGVTVLGSKVYVANFRSNNVSVIDTNTDDVIDTIAVGTGPRGIVGLGTNIYVENFDDGTISVIDTDTDTVTDTVTVGSSPSGMSVVGTDIYVTSFQDGRVYILDTTNDTLQPQGMATTYSITGPAAGLANAQSGNFAVTPNGAYIGTISITPDDGESSQVFTFAGDDLSQFFTLTPSSLGTVTIAGNNNGGLNDSSGTYIVANIPSQPDAPVAIAGMQGTATVTITAPSDGGTPITGYTVTSIPTGGLDESAGSVSSVHHLSGLTIGMSYSFTVVATNAVGESTASDPSNTITAPSADKSIISFIIPGQNGNVFNEDDRYIAITVPIGTDLTSLIPTITYTGASISPDTGVAQDFTSGMTYTVTAEDGSMLTYDISVTTAAPTFYFSNTVDTSPTELGNYFFDSDLTVPATVLPDFSLDQVTVASGATFDGDAVFNGDSENDGTVTGSATFNDSSNNYGIVNGSGTFNDDTCNEEEVQGNATFNDDSCNDNTVDQDAAFNGSAENDGTVTGPATFNGDFSENYGSAAILIRRYTSDLAPTRDFTGWTAIADGAVVNLTNASYDDSTIFQEVNGGSFVYPDKSILSFSILHGHTVINQTDHTIAVSMPSGTILTNLHPTIQYAGSSISPLSGIGQDFTNPVTYTVTSSNSLTQDYTVTVTVDTTAPTLATVTPITTPGTDTTPQYVFSSDEEGTIIYGGSCSSNTSNVNPGNNTIFFNTLALGTYADCTITVTDNVGNVSTALIIPSFTITTGTASGGGSGGSHSSGGGGGSITLPPVQTVCLVGQHFSTVTGKLCTSFITAAGTPSIPSPYRFTRSLTWKMTGDDVRQLQIYLNTHGYPVSPSGVGSVGHETSYFGLATRAALMKFQMGNKISPAVGFFGPVTRAFVESH